ncbi:MAG: helix-turn-helix domain-containing protein [Gammaproteobacteria bacterium]|nr:helix-turn-helix domain-containing protein [Gammaproteobacteria bacterium]MDH5799625.1 helix-turn-helix domain-containing protein [Gammaproteobacteria bacterium]
MSQNLLSPREVSQKLQVTTGTLSVWRSTGRYELPFVKVGSKVMYTHEAVQAFIDGRTLSQTA